MDAGTVVALVLGSVGFLWGAGTYAVNRADANKRDERDRTEELERRWLVEKRLVYTKAQAALTDYKDTLRAAWRATYMEDAGPDEPADHLSRIKEAAEPTEAALAELALMAPEQVRKAVDAAIEALAFWSWAVEYPATGASPAGMAAESEAARQLARALNAMRADLGLPQVDQYTAASDEERIEITRSEIMARRGAERKRKPGSSDKPR